MPARGKSEGAPISLFPFLSILACVIGTLILMITGLALSQIGSRPDPELVQRATAYAELRNRADELQARRRAVEDNVVREKEKQERIDTLLADEKKLESLHLRKTTVVRSRADLIKELQARREELKKLLADLQKQQEELKARIPPLEAELAKRKTASTEAVVRVAPGGSGRSGAQRPTFIEADANGLAVYATPRSAPQRVSRADIKTNPAFLKTLDQVAADPAGIAIFLIRDDGISSFETAQAVAGAHHARVGKLPLVGHGKLDLSLFAGK